jgi:hypothetical protein
MLHRNLLLTSTLKIEAAGSFETLVPLYQTAWRHIKEANNLNSYVFSVCNV